MLALARVVTLVARVLAGERAELVEDLVAAAVEGPSTSCCEQREART
jgi:hypothetical protein